MSNGRVVAQALEVSLLTSVKAVQEKDLPKQEQRSDTEGFHASPVGGSLLAVGSATGNRAQEGLPRRQRRSREDQGFLCHPSAVL